MTERLEDEEAAETTVATEIFDDEDIVWAFRDEDGQSEKGSAQAGLPQAKNVVHLEVSPGVWIDKME